MKVLMLFAAIDLMLQVKAPNLEGLISLVFSVILGSIDKETTFFKTLVSNSCIIIFRKINLIPMSDAPVSESFLKLFLILKEHTNLKCWI